MGEHGSRKVVIIGGGPAGLTAAYQLCKAHVDSVVLEQELIVGGLAKTVVHKDFGSTLADTASIPKPKLPLTSGAKSYQVKTSSGESASHASITTSDSSTTRCAHPPCFSIWVSGMAA
jgi:thioredoxin reductase